MENNNIENQKIVKIPLSLTIKDVVIVIAAIFTMASAWGFYNLRLSILEERVVNYNKEIEILKKEIENNNKKINDLDKRILILEYGKGVK